MAENSDEPEYIGRVMLSERDPAKPLNFQCWIIDSPNHQVEVGSILAIDGPNNERIICTVENMEYLSTVKDIASEFFSSGYGNPDLQPLTLPATMRKVYLKLLFRDPPRMAPPEGRWPIRYVDDRDLDIISYGIPQHHRICAGFLRIHQDESQRLAWMPMSFNSEYILGTQGAHVNITGVTGLATKTQYALFLAYSILSWARQNNQRAIIVLFNVKRRDFLQLHNLPDSWEQAEQMMASWATSVGGEANLEQRTRAMWQRAIELGIDPIQYPPTIRYFTYEADPDAELMEHPQYVSYGLGDIERSELIASLFGYDEPTLQQLNMLSAYWLGRLEPDRGNISFNMMQNELSEAYEGLLSNRTVRSPLGRAPHYSVAGAILRRVSGFLNRASNVVEREQPIGNPIQYNGLCDGLNIVQLYRLNDQEKNLVVNAVIREITSGLEAESETPPCVISIVDELNKYAPKFRSPIKEQILDVVARGRDLRFSIIGAEQFATQIDTEVYGNSQTKIVGRSDSVEISSEIYRYLGGFREHATRLRKGSMIVFHPVYPSPAILWFPPALDEIRERGQS